MRGISIQRLATVFLVVILAAAGVLAGGQGKGAPPPAFRLYVFDCGTLHFTNADTYRLKVEEVANTDMSMGCFLVVHPRGTLMWDTGAIVDGSWKPTGSPVRMQIKLTDGQDRDVTMRKTLAEQLASAGFSPANITYLALSHYHWDHIANANAFAKSAWLARKVERDLMFATPPPERSNPANYSALKNSKTKVLDKNDFDVFGDGKVVLKLAAGHTPAHQVLSVQLPKTGRVVIAGDLYHYPEERTLHRIPTRDFNPDQTAASRAAIDAFLKQTGAQLWIQHDFAAAAKLKKAPEYYE